MLADCATFASRLQRRAFRLTHTYCEFDVDADATANVVLYHHIAGSPAVAFSQNRPAMLVVGNISSHLPSISVPCLTRYTLWLDELR